MARPRKTIFWNPDGTPVGSRRQSASRGQIPPGSRSRSKGSGDLTAVLPPDVRVAVINHLALDESIDFCLTGASGAALVGTNRRIVHITKQGWRRSLSIEDIGYEDLDNVTFSSSRSGGALVGHGVRHNGPLLAVDIDQRDVALGIIPAIRRRIAHAQQNDAETPSPPNQSAFTETADRIVPTVLNTASMSLGDMLTMTPTEFEDFTGKALEAMGYTNVSRVGGSGDLAADLTAIDPQGRSVIVQCKRYTPGSRIGSPVLQSFIGMKTVHHRAERGIFVTTADYSQQAIDLAKAHDIVLIDGDDLVKIAALVMRPQSLNPPAQPVAVSDLRFCANCGTPFMEKSRFCQACGAVRA